MAILLHFLSISLIQVSLGAEWMDVFAQTFGGKLQKHAEKGELCQLEHVAIKMKVMS